MVRFKFLNKKGIVKLPKNLGIYVFKGGKEFLYIGKATNIQERVKNHFQQPGFKENIFLNKTRKIGFIKTDSEIEALILEANLIKKYQPKYNVLWKDDKNYFFVGMTKEGFPRVFITHQLKQKLEIRNLKLEIKYVGPFVDGKALRQTLKTLRKVFPYPSCRKIPKKPCLWYQLKRCPAPCLLKSELGKQIPNAKIRIKKECQKNAKNVMKILQGKRDQVLKKLKEGMKKASKIQDFEEAARLRNQILALEKILAHAKIFEIMFKEINWQEIQKTLQRLLKTKKEISRIEAYDISNIQGKEATGSMVTFTDGLSDKDYYRRFKIEISGKPNDIAMLKEVLSRRLRHLEWGWPDLILIDGGITQLSAALKCKIQNVKCKMIKFMALAKKQNKLYVENRKKPVLLKNLSREIFNLFLQLRDEAHRFAISYHKKLREKEFFDG